MSNLRNKTAGLLIKKKVENAKDKAMQEKENLQIKENGKYKTKIPNIVKGFSMG